MWLNDPVQSISNTPDSKITSSHTSSNHCNQMCNDKYCISQTIGPARVSVADARSPSHWQLQGLIDAESFLYYKIAQ